MERPGNSGSWWRRLRAQIVKELLSVLRDPRSRAILVGPPILQLFVFSFAATLEVRNIDIVVLDQDHGRWSSEFVQRVEAAGFVATVRRVDEPQALRSAIDGREALLALRFAPDFSRDVAAGRTGAVQVVLDGRRANAAQIALSYLTRITNQLALEAGGRAPVALATRNWFNPNLEYRWFIVPSLVGILSMVSSLLVTALSIARERELGTFEQLLVSPARPAEIIIGKCIPALLIGTFLGTVMLTAGIWIFRIPFVGSLGLLYAGLVVFIGSVVGIGLMISSISQTQQQAILGTFAAAVPLVLLSGFATPVENMPAFLQWLAAANPLQHFLVISQGSFMKGLPAEVVWDRIWPMLLIGATTLGSAFLFVQRRLQ